MKFFFPEELSVVLDGKTITWPRNRTIHSFSMQPAKPLRNCLYFLLQNLKDENILIEKMLQHRVSGIVTRSLNNITPEKWQKAGIGIIQVKSFQKAFINLALFYRSQFILPFIQVVGSSGKSTTKEMIGMVLRERFSTLVGYQNYNAPLGVAHNIFGLRSYHETAVLEVGMKAPGIIKQSSRIIKPHIGVITSIHRAHLVRMGSIDNIIAAKAEIIEHIDPNGFLIVNGEDENCQKLPLHLCKGRILKFGFSPAQDIWATDIKYDDFKTHFKVCTANSKPISCTLNTIGKYNISNALAAFQVGLLFAIPPQQIAYALSQFRSLYGRLEIINGILDTTIVLDNFNANPDSTEMLLNEIPHFAVSSPTILILGDMEGSDQGRDEYASRVHFEIGMAIPKLNLTHFIAIGNWGREYINGALSAGASQSKLSYAANNNDAKKILSKFIKEKSIIFFKASPYTQVMELVNSIKAKKQPVTDKKIPTGSDENSK